MTKHERHNHSHSPDTDDTEVPLVVSEEDLDALLTHHRSLNLTNPDTVATLLAVVHGVARTAGQTPTEESPSTQGKKSSPGICLLRRLVPSLSFTRKSKKV